MSRRVLEKGGGTGEEVKKEKLSPGLQGVSPGESSTVSFGG